MMTARESLLGFTRSTTSDSEHSMEQTTMRRRSHDPTKINVYTECGRHSDDWLFGGFSVRGAVKMLWEKRE